MANAGMGLIAGEPEDQLEWHDSYRDFQKNMYRTSYSDMSTNREVNVKSDYPSGFGGHIPSVRHDVLFRNTEFDRQQKQRQEDPARDAHPSFQDLIHGIPTSTRFPRGARRPPSHGVIPHDGTTTMLKPPWGVLTTSSAPLGFRNPPPTMVEGSLKLATPRSGNAFEPPVSARGMLSSRGSDRDRVRKQVVHADELADRSRTPAVADLLTKEVVGEM